MNESEVLKKGLRRQAGRGVVIDDLPAAFCSDAVGILGVAVGTKAVAETELTDEVVKWISKFLKKSYDAERTEDWERCLFAAGDRQLGNPLDLPIPESPSIADVRAALAARGIIEDSPDECGVQTLNMAMRELPEELPHDRAALRLAALESVIDAAVPNVGGDVASRPPKRQRSLSDRDQRVRKAIGAERFRSLTNAEIMRDANAKKVLRAEGLEAGSDAVKSCLDRIRKADGHLLSRDIVKKRSQSQ
ncbi:MAG: hypothetical protein SFV54_11840 [Bryobacteraceae bacterium]|nr:hypothetical protein [Bryobacteraceae bacterium]